MTRAKTTAQWRREVPAYDRAIRAVEALRALPGAPHMVAHIHPDTRIVSIILHGDQSQTEIADHHLRFDAPELAGFPWAHENICGVGVWRKDVTR